MPAMMLSAVPNAKSRSHILVSDFGGRSDLTRTWRFVAIDQKWIAWPLLGSNKRLLRRSLLLRLTSIELKSARSSFALRSEPRRSIKRQANEMTLQERQFRSRVATRHEPRSHAGKSNSAPCRGPCAPAHG